MNEGYVCGDGELYFVEVTDLLIHLRTLDWVDADGKRSLDIDDDDELLDFFYREEYYYHTEWDELDDVYYDAEGHEYES
jgi:hypothetical protein